MTRTHYVKNRQHAQARNFLYILNAVKFTARCLIYLFIGAFAFVPSAHAITVSGTLYSDEGTTQDTSGGDTISLTAATGTPSVLSTTTDAGSGAWQIEGVTGIDAGVPILIFLDGAPTNKTALLSKAEGGGSGGFTLVGQTAFNIVDDGTNQDVTLPGSPQEGDFVVFIHASDSFVTPGVQTAGYTDLFTDHAAISPGYESGYKVMGATPDTVVTFNQDVAETTAGVLQVWRGADPDNPLDVSPTTTLSVSNSAPDPPAITPVTDGSLIVTLMGLDDLNEASSVTAPSGYTDLLANDNSANADNATAAVASKVLATAQEEDPGVFGGTTLDVWAAVTVALRPAPAGDITGADLYAGRLIAKHEAASGTTTTNADFAFYDGDDDPDVPYRANGGNLEMDGGVELHVAEGSEFAPGGNVTLHGNGAGGVDGDFHLAGGATSSIATLLSSDTLTLAGSYFASSSSIFNNGGSLIFNATTTGKTVIGELTGDSSLASTTFDGAGGSWTFNDGGTAQNASTTNLAVYSGVLTTPSSGLLSIAGNYTNNGTFTDNSATLLVDGSSAQSLSGVLTGGSALGSVEFSGASTKTFSSSASTTNFTIQSGATAEGPSGGLLSFAGVYDNSLGGAFRRNGSGQIFSSGSSIQSGSAVTGDDALGDVTFEQSLTLTNASTTDLVIASGVTLTAPSFGFVTIEGDFTNNGTYAHNNATTSVSSTTAQTLTGTFTESSALGNVEFLGSGNKTFSSSASTTNLFIDSTSGVFIAPVLLTILGDYVNNANVTDSGGTVYVSSTTDQNLSGGMADTGDGSDDFNDIVFLGSGTKTFLGNASTSAFTIRSGATVVAPENGLLTVSGAYDNSQGGTYTHNAATLYFDGSATIAANSVVRNDESESSGLGNVVFSAGTVTLPGNASTTNLTIDSGTLDLSNLLVTVEGDYTNNAAIATTSSSKFYFSSTSATTLSGTMIGVGALPDTDFLGAATKTFSADATTTALTIGNGATVDISGALITFFGAYDNSQGGSLTKDATSYIAFESGSSIVSGSVVTEGDPLPNVEFLTSITLPQASTTDLKISSGTVTAPSNGLLSVSGDFTQNSTYASSSATILFDGSSGTQTISGTLTNASDLGFLLFSGGAAKTFSVNASTTDITILGDSGTVTFPPDLLSLTGNFTNNGTFASNSGTTSLIGTTTQTLSGTLIGSSAFANLTVTNTAATTTFAAAASTTNNFVVDTPNTRVEFVAGATSTIVNLLISGSSGNEVYLHSASPGTQWNIHSTGTRSVSFANVKDSDACSSAGDIDASDGTNVDGGNNDCWTFGAVGNLTISSVANQIFEVNSTNAISSITVTDNASPSIIAANDLRLVIATTTAPNADLAWDTGDATATFGGTASGKVANPVSYEGEGSILVIPVDTDFAGSDTLIIEDLSFVAGGTATSAATVLHARTDGESDTTNDATDDKTIAVTGTLVLGNHSQGQIGNRFSRDTSGVVQEELYRFRLSPSGEGNDITQLVFDLFSISGFTTSEITNASTTIDYNGNGSVNAGEGEGFGGGVISISGDTGTITFIGHHNASTTQDYILTADILPIFSGDDLHIRLLSSGFTTVGTTSFESITVSGSATDARHRRISGGEIGPTPPAGASVESGGTQGGGEEIGDEPGFFSPTANTSPSSGFSTGWTNPSDGYNSDTIYATLIEIGATDYHGLGFEIPSGNQINGIEVKIETSAITPGGSVGVEISWNGGSATTTTATSTGALPVSDTVFSLGHSSYQWGRDGLWTPADFSDANFRVRVIGQPSGNTVRLDAIQVRVYHSTTGGSGGGGGGEVRIQSERLFASLLLAANALSEAAGILANSLRSFLSTFVDFPAVR